MGTEDIEVKQQWDVTTTIRELHELRGSIVRFMEHTLQTLGRKHRTSTPFGDFIEDDAPLVHPLGATLAAIDGALTGCYKHYGETQWKQASLLDAEFESRLKDDDGV